LPIYFLVTGKLNKQLVALEWRFAYVWKHWYCTVWINTQWSNTSHI